MKKIWFMFLISLLMGLRIAAAQDETERKLTVMVYMCGSNLESMNGSASTDIREMLDAGVDGKEVSLLVMTGGSESWDLDFIDPDHTEIHEIGMNGRHRRVWQAPKMNMGSQNSLTRLLEFGKEKYPAENYALILWDHGGGPLEGACWDEQFSLDNLRLSEITGGIEDAKLGQKLSWIGFDACLMSTLEVANALAPYAEYMIASQETEPAFGWNYSFLKEIGNDADGAETGRRIVDAFFEGQEENRNVLTMACTDLAKAAEAVAAMDDFFIPIAESLNEESFSRISGTRFSVTGFGEAIRGADDNSYDLVDAIDLVSRLDKGDGKELPGLLREAVIYKRSNEENANGLSLYHPYINKNNYQSLWRDRYSRLNFSSGYIRYVKAFGTLLTGADMADWSDIVPYINGTDENGNAIIRLQLTHEQNANIASANLLILKKMGEYSRPHFSKKHDDFFEFAAIGSPITSFMMIATEPIAIGSDGLLTGSYGGHSYYIETDNELRTGPIAFDQTYDGQYNLFDPIYETGGGDTQFFRDLSRIEQKKTRVVYMLDANDPTEYPEIARTFVYDETTGSWTNRLSFSEAGFEQISFNLLDRMVPERNGNEPLKQFSDWDYNSNSFYRYGFYLQKLEKPWRFFSSDRLLTNDELYAVIEITDLQQNIYSTEPIALPDLNSYIRDFEVASGTVMTDRFRFELSGDISSAPLDSWVRFRLQITNLSDMDTDIGIADYGIILNDSRVMQSSIYTRTIPAHESSEISIRYYPEELLMLGKISTISIKLLQKDKAGSAAEEYTVRFMLNDCILYDILPLALRLSEISLGESVGKNIQADLLYFNYDSIMDRFSIDLYVKNRSEEDTLSGRFVQINGIQTDDDVKSKMPPLEPGQDTIFSFRAENNLSIGFLQDTQIIADHIQERIGFDRIGDIILRLDLGEKKTGIRITPAEKITIPHITEWQPYQWQLAGVNPLSSIKIGPLINKNDMIYAALFIQNESGHKLRLSPCCAGANGGTVPISVYFTDGSNFFASRTIEVMPESSRIVTLGFNVENLIAEGLTLDDFHFYIEFDKPESFVNKISISFTEPLPLNPERFVWVSPDRFTLHNPIPVFDPEIGLPDHAADYRIWIKAPLNGPQKKNIREGKMVLLKAVPENETDAFSQRVRVNPIGGTVTPIEKKLLQIISIQEMIYDHGEFGAFSPGTAPCFENGTDVYWPYIITEIDEQKFEGCFLTNAEFYGSSSGKKILTINQMRFSADYSENSATFTDYGYEINGYGEYVNKAYIHPWIWEVSLYPGNTVKFDSYQRVRTVPEVNIDDPFLRIMFRPIEEKDDLLILFVIRNKDGSGFFSPLIPYEEYLQSPAAYNLL